MATSYSLNHEFLPRFLLPSTFSWCFAKAFIDGTTSAGLIRNDVRSAALIAHSDCLFLTLDKKSFQHCLGNFLRQKTDDKVRRPLCCTKKITCHTVCLALAHWCVELLFLLCNFLLQNFSGLSLDACTKLALL